MKNCVFCRKHDWLLVAYFCFLSHREKEVETPRLRFWKQPARVRSKFLERIRDASALEDLENTVLLFAIKLLQNNYLYFTFYVLFQSLCKMIRNLPLENPDLYFPKWQRNFLKHNMSKLNNISNFCLSGYSIDRWSGLQSQTLICMCLHS